MLLRAAGAVPDAWALLKDGGIQPRLTEALYSRLAAVALSALLFITLALGTRGFQQTRDLLFETESPHLVLLAQPIGFMGGQARVPLAQAELWLQTGTTAAAVGAWVVERRRIDGLETRVWRTTPAARQLFAGSRSRPRFDRVELFGEQLPAHAGIVAKLRPGVTDREAALELASTASFQKGWRKPSVVALTSLQRAPLLPVGSLLGCLWLAGALSIRVRSAQAYGWALIPVSLYFATLAGAWLELVARAPVTETAQLPAEWSMVLYVAPAILGSLLAWWFRRRSTKRCRLCYRALMTPVSVGREGHRLFDPAGCEYLCAEGHGALVVGPAAQNKKDEVWTSWSSSWA